MLNLTHLVHKADPDRVDATKIDDRMVTQQGVAFNRSLFSILRGLDAKYQYVF